VVAAGLLVYGAVVLFIDESFMPGHTAGIYMHGLPAVLMFGAMLSASTVIWCEVLHLYGQQKSEKRYRLYARAFQTIGWALFAAAIAAYTFAQGSLFALLVAGSALIGFIALAKYGAYLRAAEGNENSASRVAKPPVKERSAFRSFARGVGLILMAIVFFFVLAIFYPIMQQYYYAWKEGIVSLDLDFATLNGGMSVQDVPKKVAGLSLTCDSEAKAINLADQVCYG